MFSRSTIGVGLPASLRAACCISVVSGLAFAAPAVARAQERPERSQAQPQADGSLLEALDVVLPSAVARAARSIVRLEVDRDDKSARSLTQQERMQLGLGSFRTFDRRYFQRPAGPVPGVVVGRDDAGALVATTAWNLAGARGVSLLDPATGEKKQATLLGRDENLDVALVRISGAADLVPIERVKGPTRVGGYVVLVSKTAGDTPFATIGNVSALGRYRGDAVQVSARMSYGNVGGAIVDLEGRLVGIATRLSDRSRNGQSSGVGFAAPIERIDKHLPQLAQGKTIQRRKSPYLGVQIDQREPEGRKGVRLAKVLPDSAAKKAGLEEGDIITIFHGTELKDFSQLREELDRLEPGEKVIVSVYRPSKDGERDFTIVLGARPEGEE